jgi:hypothetical protein
VVSRDKKTVVLPRLIMKYVDAELFCPFVDSYGSVSLMHQAAIDEALVSVHPEMAHFVI